MYHICIVPGCGGRTTSRYSRHCSKHKGTLRRQGAASQQAITRKRLKPYLKIVHQRIEKNPHSEAWATLDARWRALGDHAEGIIAAYQRGKPSSRIEVAAAYEVLKLAGDVPPRTVVETTLAMVVMLEMEPAAFTSDNAFWVQVSRRVRALTDLNFGERYVHATGSVKRTYRDLAPRASALFGKWLAELLGIGGLHVARLEKQDAERQATERENLHHALQTLA